MVGLVVFAALNILMLQTNYDLWTRPKVGFYSAFHKGYHFSGFDGHAYIIISKWRSLYALYRHPLLAMMLWPLSEVNGWLKDATGLNCAIHIVAVVWTLMSTLSFVLLHRIINRIVGLGTWLSLLICVFYYSFGYVMMATFVPDHMILSMTLLLLTLWLACREGEKDRPMKTWQALLMAFLTMGISTTNIVKIWLVDMISRIRRTSWLGAFTHSLLYFIPVGIIGSIFLWQQNTVKAEDDAMAKRIEQQRLKTDTLFAKEAKRKEAKSQVLGEKQVGDSKLFQWTDATVDRLPTVYENVFGEGLILHETHVLEDVNTVNARPVFVAYQNKLFYIVEAIIVTLFAAGVWCGRRHRLMWMLLAMMLFDAVMHLGFRFAIADIYIMTAHWAFIIPVSVAFLLRSVADKRQLRIGIIATVAAITLLLWWHNLSLIAHHILG